MNDQISGSTTPDQILALANGRFVVMWEDGSNTTQDVFMRVFNADGSAVTGPTLVNPVNAVGDSGIQMVATPDGGFIAYWNERPSSANGAFDEIFAQRFDNNGTAIGTSVVVGTTPSDASNIDEQSQITEFRATLGTGGGILVPHIDFDHGHDSVNAAFSQYQLELPAAFATNALFFPAIATGASGPDLYMLEDDGTPTPIPVRTDPAPPAKAAASSGSTVTFISSPIPAGDIGAFFSLAVPGDSSGNVTTVIDNGTTERPAVRP